MQKGNPIERLSLIERGGIRLTLILFQFFSRASAYFASYDSDCYIYDNFILQRALTDNSSHMICIVMVLWRALISKAH